jgi:hypothetical protein
MHSIDGIELQQVKDASSHAEQYHLVYSHRRPEFHPYTSTHLQTLKHQYRFIRTNQQPQVGEIKNFWSISAS